MSSRTLTRLALPPRQLLQFSPSLRLAATVRQASSARSGRSTPKKILLEKPTRFVPPSHPSRIRKPARSYGPSLTEEEIRAQKTKQYPHMMPPEGTFLHWFLTNKIIHLWISLSVLVSLAAFTIIANFLHTTPYRDQLPPNNFFFSHPFKFIGRWFDTYRMHVEWQSMQTAEHRKAKVEDVRKRAEYRKAHGLDQEGEGLLGKLGGWTVKSDDEVMGPGAREGRLPTDLPTESESAHAAVDAAAVQGQDASMDVEGRPQKRPLKKWLGIW